MENTICLSQVLVTKYVCLLFICFNYLNNYLFIYLCVVVFCLFFSPIIFSAKNVLLHVSLK